MIHAAPLAVDALARPPLAGRVRPTRAVLVAGTLFAVSTMLTTVWSAGMSSMDAMPMPGGWTMSMTWLRGPAESWVGAGTAFLGMWIVMMVAMMLPSLLPTIADWPESRRGTLLRVGAGYWSVWALVGAGIYPVGATLASLTMTSPALSVLVPRAAGVLVLLSGAMQFTSWKGQWLDACHLHADRAADVEAGAAWRSGLQLGWHCSLSCGNLMAVALVLGVMDLGPMAAIASAITVERLAQADASRRQTIGVAIVGLGLWLLARAHA